jgi:uncharacterized membrane protein SirB2
LAFADRRFAFSIEREIRAGQGGRPMSPLFYQITHVLSAMLLVGFIIAACADPRPERRRFTMIITGILSLVVLVAAIGLVHKTYGMKFTGWMYAKIVIWILLAGMSGMAFRRSTFAGVLMIVVIALVGAAVYLVYARPMIFGL